MLCLLSLLLVALPSISFSQQFGDDDVTNGISTALGKGSQYSTCSSIRGRYGSVRHRLHPHLVALLAPISTSELHLTARKRARTCPAGESVDRLPRGGRAVEDLVRSLLANASMAPAGDVCARFAPGELRLHHNRPGAASASSLLSAPLDATGPTGDSRRTPIVMRPSTGTGQAYRGAAALFAAASGSRGAHIH